MIKKEYSKNKGKSHLLLLDRDGTLIKNCAYNVRKNKMFFNKKLLNVLRKFDIDTEYVIVSNQSGIGREIISLEQVLDFNNSLVERLLAFGITISCIIFCPHAPNDYCDCRKPNSKMIEEIVTRGKYQKEQCLFLGDQETDKLAAERTGIGFILIDYESMNSKSGVNLKDVEKFLSNKSNKF